MPRNIPFKQIFTNITPCFFMYSTSSEFSKFSWRWSNAVCICEFTWLIRAPFSINKLDISSDRREIFRGPPGDLYRFDLLMEIMGATPPGNRAFLRWFERDYGGFIIINPSIRPYFLGWHLGGLPLDSHDWYTLERLFCREKSVPPVILNSETRWRKPKKNILNFEMLFHKVCLTRKRHTQLEAGHEFPHLPKTPSWHQNISPSIRYIVVGKSYLLVLVFTLKVQP